MKMIGFGAAILVGAVFFAGPSRAAEGEIPLYFQPQPPSQSSNVYLVTFDGECEGAGPEAELLFNLWLNTVFIPSELASSGYSRAWSLRTVLPLTAANT